MQSGFRPWLDLHNFGWFQPVHLELFNLLLPSQVFLVGLNFLGSKGQFQAAAHLMVVVHARNLFEFGSQGNVPLQRPNAEPQQRVGNSGPLGGSHFPKGKPRRMAAHGVGFQHGNRQALAGQKVRGQTTDDTAANHDNVPRTGGQAFLLSFTGCSRRNHSKTRVYMTRRRRKPGNFYLGLTVRTTRGYQSRHRLSIIALARQRLSIIGRLVGFYHSFPRWNESGTNVPWVGSVRSTGSG